MSARIADQEIQDAKSADLARLTGLKFRRQGNALWACCPFHKEKTPSFKVENGFYKCFGCGASGDAISWVRETEHLNFADAVKRLSNAAAPIRFGGVQVRESVRRDDDGKNIKKRAMAMWEEAQPLAGTHAEKYLRARGIRLPPSPELRFSPRESHRESGLTLPALVARLSDEDGFAAVQRIFLDPVLPKKADVTPNKKTLSKMGYSSIRLRAPKDDRLGIAEGLETSLSAMQIYAIPVWCAVAAHRLSSIQVPDHVRFISIFADPDPTGREQAEKAVIEWEARGKHVELYYPEAHFKGAKEKDFNDVMRA
jgi:hypothetical protein